MKKTVKVMMTNIRNSNKGFSLVEMIVVMAIISIMAAIGVPAVMNQISRIKLTRGTRDVAVALQAARLKAIAKNVKYKVYFTFAATDSYVLMTCSGGANCDNTTLGAGSGWIADTASEYGTTKTLEANLNITAPAAAFQVIFYPAGTATDQTNTLANQKICINNTSTVGGTLSISVNAASGKVSVNAGC